MSVYKQWFLKEILEVGKRNTLLVLPITSQEVDYRDTPPAYDPWSLGSFCSHTV